MHFKSAVHCHSRKAEKRAGAHPVIQLNNDQGELQLQDGVGDATPNVQGHHVDQPSTALPHLVCMEPAPLIL